MFTKYDLITMILKDVHESLHDTMRNGFSKENDSFFEKELPVKCVRKGYFVIA